MDLRFFSRCYNFAMIKAITLILLFIITSCSDERTRIGLFLRTCDFDSDCIKWFEDYKTINKKIALVDSGEASNIEISKAYVRTRIGHGFPDLESSIGVYLDTVDFYSHQMPNSELLRAFRLDFYHASLCLHHLWVFYEIEKFGIDDIQSEISAIFFRDIGAWNSLRFDYYKPTRGIDPNVSDFELGARYEELCRFKPIDNDVIRKDLITSSGSYSRNLIFHVAKEFEAKHGNKYRKHYKKFIED